MAAEDTTRYCDNYGCTNCLTEADIADHWSACEACRERNEKSFWKSQEDCWLLPHDAR